MKKIILAIDVMKPDTPALDYACYMARLTRSKLVGVFLENLETQEIITPRQIEGKVYAEASISTALPENELKRTACEKAIQQFREGCASRETEAAIHRDRSAPLEELTEESRFADLIIVPSDMALEDGKAAKAFAEETAAKAECPVLIAPARFYVPEEIIFAYDGRESSMAAIKHFTYLFPELSNKPVYVVQTRKAGNYLSYQYKLKEWMILHYKDVTLLPLTGDGNEEDMLSRYILDRENALLVIGAFGRSKLSRMLKPSKAHQVLQWLSVPVFTAHH